MCCQGDVKGPTIQRGGGGCCQGDVKGLTIQRRGGVCVKVM